MTIRGFNAEELPALYEIEKECFTRGFQWGRKVFSEMLLSASKKNNVWVAEEDGKIVGFLLANERGNKVEQERLLTLPTPEGGGFSNYTPTTTGMFASPKGVAFDGNDLPNITSAAAVSLCVV